MKRKYAELEKDLEQRSFVRQLSSLQNRRDDIEAQMLLNVGNRLVAHAKRTSTMIDDGMVSLACKVARISPADSKEWTDSLNDVLRYGEKLPVVHAAREWHREFQSHLRTEDLPLDFLSQMTYIAKIGGNTLREVAPGLSGMELISIFEIQTEHWPFLFASWGLSEETLDRALTRMYPDLNEAILRVYKQEKPQPLKDLSEAEATKLEAELKLDHVEVQKELEGHPTIPEAQEYEPSEEDHHDFDECDSDPSDESEPSGDELDRSDDELNRSDEEVECSDDEVDDDNSDEEHEELESDNEDGHTQLKVRFDTCSDRVEECEDEHICEVYQAPVVGAIAATLPLQYPTVSPKDILAQFQNVK